MSTGVKVTLWVIGIIFGSGTLLAVCGGVALYAFSVYASGAKEIVIDQYSIMGKGIVAKNNTPPAPGVRAESTVDMRTFSEFGLITITPSNPNLSLNPEIYFQDLRQSGAQIQQRNVFRMGLTGIQYESTASAGRPAHRGEVFQINNTILISIYINGHDHPLYRTRTKRYSREKSLELDDPESFFATLKQR